MSVKELLSFEDWYALEFKRAHKYAEIRQKYRRWHKGRQLYAFDPDFMGQQRTRFFALEENIEDLYGNIRSLSPSDYIEELDSEKLSFPRSTYSRQRARWNSLYWLQQSAVHEIKEEYYKYALNHVRTF